MENRNAPPTSPDLSEFPLNGLRFSGGCLLLIAVLLRVWDGPWSVGVHTYLMPDQLYAIHESFLMYSFIVGAH